MLMPMIDVRERLGTRSGNDIHSLDMGSIMAHLDTTSSPKQSPKQVVRTPEFPMRNFQKIPCKTNAKSLRIVRKIS